MSSEPSNSAVVTPGAVAQDEGKVMALVVYGLYLLSLPSIGLLMLIGAVVAYSARGTAAPWVRSHLDKEIQVFWTTLWWTIGLGIAFAISVVLTFVLIGIPMLWLVSAGFVVLAVWFHIVSFIGLMRLIQDKPVA